MLDIKKRLETDRKTEGELIPDWEYLENYRYITISILNCMRSGTCLCKYHIILIYREIDNQWKIYEESTFNENIIINLDSKGFDIGITRLKKSSSKSKWAMKFNYTLISRFSWRSKWYKKS